MRFNAVHPRLLFAQKVYKESAMELVLVSNGRWTTLDNKPVLFKTEHRSLVCFIVEPNSEWNSRLNSFDGIGLEAFGISNGLTSDFYVYSGFHDNISSRCPWRLIKTFWTFNWISFIWTFFVLQNWFECHTWWLDEKLDLLIYDFICRGWTQKVHY